MLSHSTITVLHVYMYMACIHRKRLPYDHVNTPANEYPPHFLPHTKRERGRAVLWSKGWLHYYYTGVLQIIEGVRLHSQCCSVSSRKFLKRGQNCDLKKQGGAKVNPNNTAYRGGLGVLPQKESCNVDPLRLILTQSESQEHTHLISTKTTLYPYPFS